MSEVNVDDSPKCFAAPIERIWEKARWEGDCLRSHLSLDGRGYAQVVIQQKHYKVGRLLLEEHTGEPPNGRLMRHSCHNTWCINPEHLSWGNQSENMRDCGSAMRARNGHGDQKLSDDDVRDIRKRHIPGRGGNKHDLAREYGVSHFTIRSIATGFNRRLVL